MAGATNFFEDDLLDLIFTNVAAPNVGDAAGLPPSVAANNFHISLHTVTILDTATLQTQNEAAYTGYSRVAVARSTAGWTVSAGQVSNDALITFPTSTSGPETELDVGIGFAASGAGNLDIFAVLDASLVVNSGVTPEFAISALAISLD